MKFFIIPLGIVAILLSPWKMYSWQNILVVIWFAWFVINIYFVKKVWLNN